MSIPLLVKYNSVTFCCACRYYSICNFSAACCVFGMPVPFSLFAMRTNLRDIRIVSKLCSTVYLQISKASCQHSPVMVFPKRDYCVAKFSKMTAPNPNFPTLVSPETLNDMQEKSENVRILDCSWHFPFMNRNAKAEYDNLHIPDALFFDIDECADKSTELAHMIPDETTFEDYVGIRGINNDTHVVVYDTSEQGMFSSQRVWWTFRYFGHEMVSILNGGLQKWVAHELPTTSAQTVIENCKFQARARPHLIATFEELEKTLEDQNFQIVDARPTGRFEGKEPEPRPGIESGRMPNAINLPFGLIIDPEKFVIKSQDELLQVFEDVGVDVNKPIIATCGSGMTAAGVALAAFLCGNHDVKVYDGSWMEWYMRAKKENIVRF